MRSPCRRIVVIGAESTGTTTLAADLADWLSVPWAAEYLRRHAEERAAAAGSIWDVVWAVADFERVADGQDELEDEAVATWTARSGRPPPLLICDTDALATALWHRRYLDSPAPHMLRRAARRPPSLYLLTTPDGVDFHQDGLRDGEHLRHDMTEWFRAALSAQAVPWVEVTGDRPTRVDLSLRAMERATGTLEPVSATAPTQGAPDVEALG